MRWTPTPEGLVFKEIARSANLMKTVKLACFTLIGLVTYPHASPAPRLFEVGMHHLGDEENFFVKTALADFIKDAEAELKLPASQRTKIVNGVVSTTRGNGGFNGDWDWHIDPDSVGMAEVTIELCDLSPSSVTWNQGRFCPWDSYILREVTVTGLMDGTAPKGKLSRNSPGEARISDEAGSDGSHRLEYAIHSPGRMELELRTVDGKHATTLVNAYRVPGRYHASWNDRGLSRGLYHLILKHDGLPASARTLLLR